MDFDAFYRDTSRRLLRYAYALTGDPGETQDLVQEAYARAWQRRRSAERLRGSGGLVTAGGQPPGHRPVAPLGRTP